MCPKGTNNGLHPLVRSTAHYSNRLGGNWGSAGGVKRSNNRLRSHNPVGWERDGTSLPRNSKGFVGVDEPTHEYEKTDCPKKGIPRDQRDIFEYGMKKVARVVGTTQRINNQIDHDYG
jgi:hypothetical protein